ARAPGAPSLYFTHGFFDLWLSFIQPIVLNVHAAKDFFPENGLLYFVVTVRDRSSESQRHVVVNIPSHRLKRFYELSEIAGTRYVIFIDDIVRENIDILLPNEVVEGVYSIKFNRDSEFRWDEDYSADMLEKLEKKLARRDQGAPSRFLYENTMPRNLQFFLAAMFQINIEDMFEGGRYHNLSDLNEFPSFDESLHFPSFRPIPHPQEAASGDIFNITRTKEILLHIPYHAYTPVLSFFNQAAVDEKVSEIYISLYRVASDSHIVNALISAARNGKKVVCFIELKARFDEVNNIRWSKIMKEAGVQLVYSDPRIKVHSKTALVKRSEEGGARYYSLISTGNFNEITARFYTDHVFFTADDEIAKELLSLFTFMQSKKVTIEKMKLTFDRLRVSQFNWIQYLEKAIRKQIKKAQAGEKAMIRIKVNNLEDPWIIGELYKASQYGVEVNLLVRSVCCLVPQKEGISENIRIKRIVDRFLEHSRLFIFGEGEEASVLMGSSDLMIRNLRRRIEVMLSVKDEGFKKELTD
ncbi:MAG: polyphosphate kinase 1, partial [Chitinophagaceae bacterium]